MVNDVAIRSSRVINLFFNFMNKILCIALYNFKATCQTTRLIDSYTYTSHPISSQHLIATILMEILFLLKSDRKRSTNTSTIDLNKNETSVPCEKISFHRQWQNIERTCKKFRLLFLWEAMSSKESIYNEKYFYARQ